GIEERLGWVAKVRDQNPDIDLLKVDYLPESPSLARVKFDGLAEDARARGIHNFKAEICIAKIGHGPDHNVAQLGAGYLAAATVARRAAEESGEANGIAEAKAKIYQARAREIATDSSLVWFALWNLKENEAVFRYGLAQSTHAFLKELKGYDQLFRSPLAFC